MHISDLDFCYPQGPGSRGSRDEEDNAALHKLSFSVDAGERVALIGANGSGKSTLLLAVAGCLAPRKGQVLLAGEDCTGQARAAGKHLGLLFQNQDCQLLMPSVREELLLSLKQAELLLSLKQAEQLFSLRQAESLPSRNQGERSFSPEQKDMPAVEEFAARFGLTHLLDKAPHRLSQGERQRVALGTLCIRRPRLLLLDEPTAALDPQARRALADMLHPSGESLMDPMALLMATHDLDFALRSTTRTLLLHRGRLVADGPSREILRQAELLRAHQLDLPLCLQEAPA